MTSKPKPFSQRVKEIAKELDSLETAQVVLVLLDKVRLKIQLSEQKATAVFSVAATELAASRAIVASLRTSKPSKETEALRRRVAGLELQMDLLRGQCERDVVSRAQSDDALLSILAALCLRGQKNAK